MKTIGIDLGTNSIGWAIRNTLAEGNQIIDYGVLTFNKGVASEKGKEFPKVQKRTESRSKRHNYQAEKYRKWKLLEFLIEKDMCPLSREELDKWKKYIKGEKKQYPQSKEFINWLRFDFNGDGKPDFHLFGKNEHESYYVFRALVIDEGHKKVFQNNPKILGRIFYQLVQRRGFRGRDEEEAKTMLQGSEKTGTAGRNDIAEYIDKYKTLGAALYHYQAENGGRIRQRYNLRKDYEDELKEICKIHNINESDYKKIHSAIIWQRPLRTQKGLIGMCIYEHNKKRVSISHPLYEEYYIWMNINNLKIELPEGIDKNTYLQEKIYPIFLKHNDFELSTIIKQLHKDGAKMNAKFNEKTKIIAAKLMKSFHDILGEDWKEKYKWDSVYERDNQPPKKSDNQYSFEDIWHVLKTFDEQENLKKFALEKLNLTKEKAEKFSKIKLNRGYAPLSLSAIKKILPFLQKGFLYSQAVYLANMYKVLGKEKNSNELINQLAERIREFIDNNKEKKTLNNIVNSLIQAELNNEYPYQIENKRELDDEESLKIRTKIQDNFGQKTWDEFTDEKKSMYLNYVSTRFKKFLMTNVLSRKDVFIKQPRLHDQIFQYMQNEYNISEEQKKHLWHPSEQEKYKPAVEYKYYTADNKKNYISERSEQRFLKNHINAEYQGRTIRLLGNPEPESKGFKNPMALKTLHKLKQLLNYLLQTGKIDEDTRIVIEISRELNDANKRKAIERWSNDRKIENESFKNIIREINKECRGANFNENDKILIRKIRLWEEQKRRCIYTGKPIGFCDIFNGNNFDFEHTIPTSISFDSELKNLTIADREYNRNLKGKRFPTQMPNYYQSQKINGHEYPAIIRSIEVLFGRRTIEKKTLKGKEIEIVHWAKIDDLKRQYNDWKNKASSASTKDYKDFCIQNYHYTKMNLDYLQAKLKTFTIDEYKAGWRNSQLRDTQIITKYALSYLKTVFKKVEVEKPEVVNSFKEIYKIKILNEKKNRSIHSHHAIDAAILTLIPPFFDRDKILEKYNEEKDKKSGTIYHEQPKNWSNFSADAILSIENKVLINNFYENKTTLPAVKKIRKKGKIEYLKYKDENGIWQLRLDQDGKKIPKIAKGDTIRGQLHGESFYGAIKQPLRDENNKILFDKNGNMKLSDEIYLVIRKDLVYKKNASSPGFKTLEEIKKVIVDQNLFMMIKRQVETASDFKTALDNGIYMIDKKGKKINKIRHIRCKESMKYETAIKVHEHSFKSTKEYKRQTLAKNGENTLCLYYQKGKDRAINILSIGQVAELKFKNDLQFFNEKYYNHIETRKGKSKSEIPLYAVLRTGCKVLFYKNSIEELKEIHKDRSHNELSKRLYKIYQFESDGRIKFRHHLAAGVDADLKKENKEYSYFDIEENQLFLRLTKGEWNFAIDSIDFIMHLDGTIEFNEKA